MFPDPRFHICFLRRFLGEAASCVSKRVSAGWLHISSFRGAGTERGNMPVFRLDLESFAWGVSDLGSRLMETSRLPVFRGKAIVAPAFCFRECFQIEFLRVFPPLQNTKQTIERNLLVWSISLLSEVMN
jgi:hypothetical protein